MIIAYLIRVFRKYSKTVLRKGQYYRKVLQSHNVLPGNLSMYATISFPESTFPLSSGTGNESLWDIAFQMTRFLSWVQLRRRKRLDKMATNAQEVFHDGIEFSVTKLGNPNLELKKEQCDVIRAICLEKRDVLTLLPTGFGKSLCYQALPEIFDFMEVKVIKENR